MNTQKAPKYKVGDFLQLVNCGQCCGANTPSDHGYGWDDDPGYPPYSEPVEVTKVQKVSALYDGDPLYEIEYKHGRCNIYEPGLENLPSLLDSEIARIRKEINQV